MHCYKHTNQPARPALATATTTTASTTTQLPTTPSWRHSGPRRFRTGRRARTGSCAKSTPRARRSTHSWRRRLRAPTRRRLLRLQAGLKSRGAFRVFMVPPFPPSFGNSLLVVASCTRVDGRCMRARGRLNAPDSLPGTQPANMANFDPRLNIFVGSGEMPDDAEVVAG